MLTLFFLFWIASGKDLFSFIIFYVYGGTSMYVYICEYVCIHLCTIGAYVYMYTSLNFSATRPRIEDANYFTVLFFAVGLRTARLRLSR